MRHAASRLLTACFVVTVAARARAAEPPASVGVDGVNANLARLNDTVAELVALARRQVEQQDLALVMKRMELSTTLMIEVNRQIAANKDERERLVPMIEDMEARSRELSAGLPKEGADVTPEMSQRRQKAAGAERAVAQFKRRMKDLDTHVLELENRAASQRDEISRWQESIDAYFQRKKP